jgi:hypothetical protein
VVDYEQAGRELTATGCSLALAGNNPQACALVLLRSQVPTANDGAEQLDTLAGLVRRLARVKDSRTTHNAQEPSLLLTSPSLSRLPRVVPARLPPLRLRTGDAAGGAASVVATPPAGAKGASVAADFSERAQRHVALGGARVAPLMLFGT